MRRAWLLAGLLLAAFPVAAAADTIEHQAQTRAQALVARMTDAEAVAQLQSDAPSIPRLGIPAHEWWNEALHGLARNGVATVFPQAIGMAASWDPALLRAVGHAIAIEARTRFERTGPHAAHPRYAGLTLWSPNVNIFRDPRWGRGQETYGEDPFLTGSLAVGFIDGLQGPDPAHPLAIATPKHFAAHSGPESGRYGFDADVSPHDMAETYLPAFRMAVTQAHAGSVMCAYNALHGVPNCANPALLRQTLRQDWGFSGYVVSDCDAVDDLVRFHHIRPDLPQAAALALRSGTDLDCGRAYAALGAALRQGLVRRADLDLALTRLVAARLRLGEIGTAQAPPTRPAPPGENDALALRAAAESLVLLSNDHDTLPLRPGGRLAVIGPDADTVEALEANYHGTALAPVTPLAAIRARWGAGAVTYAQGAPVADGVPVPIPETALRTGDAPDSPPGLVGAYYRDDVSGTPALMRTDRIIDFDWDRASPAFGLEPGHFAVRWRGVLRPPAPGDYVLAVHVDRCFDCAGHDSVRLMLDGREILADPGTEASPRVAVHFADAGPHQLQLELRHAGADGGIRLQWLAPAEVQRDEALRAAAQADTVVAFLGLSPDVEGEALSLAVPGFEGGDRTALGLPAPQAALLDALLAAGAQHPHRKLVVVLMSGGAVSLGDADARVPALLQAWYPGQAGGTAIADALAGASDPAGRLPVTVYRDAADLPAFIDYGMRGRTYRYFAGVPLHPFGAGLSYTRFAYGPLSLSGATLRAGDPLSVSASVRNTGARDGDAVAELYLVPPAGPLSPSRALVGFQRLHLAAGEVRTVTFRLAPRRFGSVDALGQTSIEPGRYTLFLGGGQPGYADGVSASLAIRGRQVLPR